MTVSLTNRLLAASLIVTAMALLSCAHRPSAAVLEAPFDSHRDQVGLDVVLDGRSLRFILDSAVDPSLVDSATARELSLPRLSGQWDVEGVGKDRAEAYDSRLERFELAGRPFGPIDTAVADMTRLRERYGRPLHGILGYSFLKDRTVIIDYRRDRVAVFDQPSAAAAYLAACRKRHQIPMTFIEGDTILLVPDLKIGPLVTTAILDTGSSNGLRLWEDAPELASIRPYFPVGEAGTSVGARGEAASRTGVLSLPVSLGPFTLANSPVTLAARASGGARPVNLGNRFFRAAGITLLLDYRSRKVGFYGECG